MSSNSSESQKFRPWVAAFLGFVLIGLGQAFNNQRTKAYLFLAGITLLIFLDHFFSFLFFHLHFLKVCLILLYAGSVLDAFFSASKAKLILSSKESLSIYLKKVILIAVPIVFILISLYFFIFYFIGSRALAYEKKGQIDRAIFELEMGARLRPDWFVAHYNLGRLYMKNENWAAAISEIDKAIEAVSELNKTAEVGSQYSEAYLVKGIIHKKKGDLEQALASFSLAIEKDSKSSKAYLSRGSIYSEKGLLEEAQSDFDSALEFASNADKNYFAHAILSRGWLLFKMKDFDKAILDYNKAIEALPSAAGNYYYRGLVYYAMEKYEESLSDYKKALQLDASETARKIAYDDFMEYIREKNPTDSQNVREQILSLLSPSN